MNHPNNILKVGGKNLNRENWKVYHPSGRHMFTCGEKKALWYVERNLATIIGKKKIKFNFTPKGNGFEDNELFGRSVRESQCVVSGEKTGLQRHHIVPYCYRTYFPDEFKSKNHHDVVLINFEKHSEYEQIANRFKDEIARIYGVKTITELNIEYTSKLREINKDSSMLLSTLHSLFKNYGNIRQDKLIDKLHFIADNSNIDYDVIVKMNYIQLYKMYLYLSNLHNQRLAEFKEKNRMYYDHGYHVVQKLDTDEKIEDFVKLWRKHFVDTMNPKYMPVGWSQNFRVKTKIK